MTHEFEFVYPDGPYKTTTDAALTATISYTGPRYILLEIHPNGDFSLVGGNTIKSALESQITNMNQTLAYRILDVTEHPVEVCYLTKEYTHEELPEIVKVLPNDKEFRYNWGTKIIEEVIDQNSITWDVNNDQITSAEFRVHPLTTAEVIQGFLNQADRIEAVLADPIEPMPAEDVEILNDHIAWLRAWGTTYDGFEHWEVPYPTEIPNWSIYQK